MEKFECVSIEPNRNRNMVYLTREYFEEKYFAVAHIDTVEMTLTFWSWTSCWDGTLGEMSTVASGDEPKTLSIIDLMGHGSRLPSSMKIKTEMKTIDDTECEVWFIDGYIVKTTLQWENYHDGLSRLDEDWVEEHLRRVNWRIIKDGVLIIY